MTVLKRIMPCLLYNGKHLVKTIRFKNPSYIGDPINAIKIYNDKEVDELVLLDIKATKENRRPDFKRIEAFASECFMPFAYGGGVSEIEDFRKLFSIGVEKIVVNNLLLSDPSVVREAVKIFGVQSVIGSIDFRKNLWSRVVPYAYSGRKIKMNLTEYAKYVEDLGVGELLIYSVDKDGTWEGFDYDVVQQISDQVSVPLIATGGAGNLKHIKKVLYDLDINAVALGSMAVYQKKGMGVLIGFPKRKNVIHE